jgi:hypothetical protein
LVVFFFEDDDLVVLVIFEVNFPIESMSIDDFDGSLSGLEGSSKVTVTLIFFGFGKARDAAAVLSFDSSNNIQENCKIDDM